MKPINDFPHTIYFEEHIVPLFGEAHLAAIHEKYGPAFPGLSVYELLVNDNKLGDGDGSKTVAEHVLVDVAAGNMPAGVDVWGIDQIRLFARWMDSPRLESVPVPYDEVVPAPTFFGDNAAPGRDDDKPDEHHPLGDRLKRHIHND